MSYKKLESDILDYSRSVEPVWHEVVDQKTGKFVLKKIGETDVDKAIQKAAESCDLKTIVSNLAVAGSSLPPLAVGQFGDVSNSPDGLVELDEQRRLSVQRSQEAFNSLPEDFRSQFKDPEDLMKRYNSGVIEEYIRKKEAEKMKSVVGESEVKDGK